jgi:hypothetical protein
MDALINVGIPVFGLILTGYLTGRFEVLGEEPAAALTRFVYYFAFAAALFVFSARAPIDKTFNWPFIGAFVAGRRNGNPKVKGRSDRRGRRNRSRTSRSVDAATGLGAGGATGAGNWATGAGDAGSRRGVTAPSICILATQVGATPALFG